MDNEKRLASIEMQIKSISKNPGVYIIYNKLNQVIYVGKAKNLNNRLRSHFALSTDFSKSRVIRETGIRIEVHEVVSEKEALLLEFNMIQEHRPRLNEKWKDGKTYPYLEVTTGEDYPRFIMTRERDNKGSIYLGPFSDVGAVKRSLKYALSMFPVADCKKEIHLGDSEKWAKTCIRRRTRKCFRPCEIEIDSNEYRENVDSVIQFIEGKTPEMLISLNEKMQFASEEMNYEGAAKFRDLIKSVNRTIEKQSVMLDDVSDAIIFAEARNKTELAVSIQKVENGRISRQDSAAISKKELGDSPWSDFVISFFINIFEVAKQGNEKTSSKNILLNVTHSKEIIPQLEALGYIVSKPDSLIEKQLVEMTINHAKKYLHRRFLLRKQKGLPTARVSDLQELLRMEYPPFIIDTFDISTLLGSNTVGSCVRFKNGRPLKKGYRRFKIRTVDGQDDFASMEEVVFRRYRDVKDGVDPKGLPIPDLIVIDGGQEQLKRAHISLQKLNLEIIVVGLAKKEEEIYLINQEKPLSEKKNRPGLLLLMAGRDEAHRFAVTYHRSLRQKTGLKSLLDSIQGIGPKRRQKLIKNYRSISNIAKESSETLSELIGIDSKLASKIILTCRKYTTNQIDTTSIY
ncbi:MAG: UvrABC system protein C [Candidatus Heimdallarchaeota archaeon LC_2]|nr:MAG: UvrABC system protein C [Candidatus Heimdallarchaeota archaeon LC_2]